jgi:lysophospholipase L1-like esterase
MLLALALGLAALPVMPATPARAASAQNPAGEHWVATWITSPVKGLPKLTLHDQTVRMIVHTSIGGDRFRVEFSNAFGDHSLFIGAAHLAIRAKGSSIVPGSDRTLTFNGSPSVTIPPGAPMLSDPVSLKAPPLADLAVSLYVPEAVVPFTEHSVALETTYISGPGNFTGAESIKPVHTNATWYWLSSVDAEAASNVCAIVGFGDSITDGYNSKLGANGSWPAQLAARFQANPATAHLAVVNAGISGNRVLHNFFGPDALARFDRDVLAQDGVKYVVILEGINDLGFPHEPPRFKLPHQEVTAAQVIGGLRQLVERAHAHGIRVIGATLTPYKGSLYYSKEGEAKREAINRWIRTSGVFDGVVDFAAVIRDPKHPLRFLPAYDSGDHLHPNDVGYKAMADAINPALFH